MEPGDLDLQSLAMIGGFFIAGFAAVWVFLTLRQSENHKPGKKDDEAG